MNWEKLCPNLSFTAENKMGNLCKAIHISNLIWWMIYSISSNFKNFSMNLVKYIFHWWKWHFEPIGNFTHTTGFLILGEALLILLPLYFKMLKKQMLTQADNHKHKKCHNYKKYSKKMGLKFQNPKFSMLCKTAFTFLIKCQPFGVQRSIRPFWNK